MSGKKENEWKISIKSEEELIMDKHKPGKIFKIVSGVFVFAFFAILVFWGYGISDEKDKDKFVTYLSEDKFEEAKDYYDYEKDFEVLVDEIISRRKEYDETGDEDVFISMWKLIFMFESNIRVSDKAFYLDLKYFPKEKKVVKLGCDKSLETHMTNYMEKYYESIINSELIEDNSLYNYYIDVELGVIEDAKNVPNDIDIIIRNDGYDINNESKSYVKKFMDILDKNDEYTVIVGGADGIFY